MQSGSGQRGKAPEHGDGIDEIDDEIARGRTIGILRGSGLSVHGASVTLASPPVSGPEATSLDAANRFGRPKEPHDWRWVVGGIGRTLIAVGLLMFAFVAYQLWGTGIQTAQAQSRLENTFEDALAAATTLPVAPTITSAAPTTTAVPVPTTVPPPGATAPPTSSTTSTTSTIPAPAIERPEVGGALARIEIPKIDVNVVVVEGVTTRALADGPGHFPETPFPGQLGNAAIAGHRTTHGAPFFDLDQVQPGDEIVVTTLAGRYVYLVTGSQIVAPVDYARVIPTVDPTTATLTLTTCHPQYQAAKRLIVSALLDPSRSSIVTQATPPSTEGMAEPLDIPGDDSAPTVVASTVTGATTTTTMTGTTGTDSDTATSVASPTVSAPDTTTTAQAGGAGGIGGIGGIGRDAFSGGWFDDRDALPQVALWGFALTAIALGAYAVSRGTRRNWIGALVGFVPFVVMLYFWFQNVNRLLPPGL